jgi:hypothetical protein
MGNQALTVKDTNKLAGKKSGQEFRCPQAA